MSHSEEEEIARDYICFGNPDATVIIVLCVNLLDEAKKKGISIDFEALEKSLGIPVVGTIARKEKTLKKLMQKVLEVASRKN